MNTPTVREQLISINRIVNTRPAVAQFKADDLYEKYVSGEIKMTDEEFDFLADIFNRLVQVQEMDLLLTWESLDAMFD